ncbi:lipoprotein ABC transporter ATP-binding protein [Mameliella alba]|uniref:ABC transporter ATP-binding protein n=1 Tax=Mameliella alba TaxID=561184 RepID=UPI00088EF327|nr:ABC transporter ATP-binding protein [Mameliella alba]OWV48354.1 ABC transporter ATP-binding protein [Mameliella alba]PTR40402.1 putative ABC transport system ATP-binding protein [Mameliella alba]SDD01814.1 putative ABC transport system ATP-binding protein [Mameliella alba]BBU57652.1 lipoprotein ABC transporter ATP-binding protein [Mameliella alba]GGF44679.1 lipoprotein ABC transporter ATP-binding protein [Mameliella alba]
MLLQVSGVTKSFAGAEGPVPVLSGVDLSLDLGQTMSLQGESGSGKSTLLHIVGGLDTVDGGQVLFDGRDVAALDEAGRAALRRSDVAVIFQQFNLIPSLDVSDNIRFQARLAGREDAAQVARLIETLGLGDHRHKYPEQLSGGQQQRVAIARALAARPRLILADEPTGNLDETTAAEVLDQMLALVGDTGAALMVVTHSPAVAARMDRQLHLRAGKLA